MVVSLLFFYNGKTAEQRDGEYKTTRYEKIFFKQKGKNTK
jgi:hypothetical protein